MKMCLFALFFLVVGAGSLRAQETTKPVDAWREICAKDVPVKDDELATLELGCAARTLFSEGGGDGRYFYLVNHPEDKKARDVFDQWLAGEGSSKNKAWAAGALAPADEKYRNLFEAVAVARCDKGDLRTFTHPSADRSACSEMDKGALEFFFHVREDGPKALEKGYRGKALTEPEIDVLHSYRMWMEIAVRTPHYLPFQLKLMRTTPHNTSFGRGFQVGDAIPPFELPFLDTVTKRDAYQDLPYDFDPAGFLHRASLLFLFDLFDGYEPDGEALVAKPYHRETGESAEDYFSYPGTGKPLVLMTVRVTDGYWFNIAAMDIIPLWYAYRDRADFLLVNMTYSDPSVHAEEIFGPFAGKATCLLHQDSQEKLAREAKVFWMSQPCFSLPTVLDTPVATLRNAMMTEAGDARTFIFDKNGELAFEFSKMILEKPAAWGGGSIYGNVMANRLDRLFSNDGKNDGVPVEMDYRSPTYLDLENAIMASVEKDIVQAMGTVTAINASEKRLQVKLAEGVITVQFGPHTLIERATNWSHLDPATFEEIKIGDAIKVDFRMSKTSGEVEVRAESQQKSDYFSYRTITNLSDEVIVQPDRIAFGRLPVAPIPNRNTVWSMGTVKSVNLATRTITFVNDAFVDHPTLGYGYWKTAKGARGNADTELYRKVITTWVEGNEAQRTRIVHYSDGVFHFHHDQIGDLKTIKPGMKICALYPAHHDDLPLIHPYVIRSFNE